MVSIWWGTQADEAFPEAWQSDTGGQAQFRSKVYLSPKLWYLRVNVIEAQDLATKDLLEPVTFSYRTFLNHILSLTIHRPKLLTYHESLQSVRVRVGPYQTLRTRPAIARTGSPFWNEDLLFVAAEPFDDMMHLFVEDRVGPRVRISSFSKTCFQLFGENSTSS
jgi:hypothetical protein